MGPSSIKPAGYPVESILGALGRARRVWSTRGAGGIAQAFAWRLRARFYEARRWWYRDHPVVGWFVELSGNRVRIEGCRFHVSHPQISRAIKSRLLRGRYERSELQVLKQWLSPDSPVIELGGGIGVVSTLVNRRLREPAKHVVVEANPALIPVIDEQRVRNAASFTIVHAAVDYSGDECVPLEVGRDFLSSRTAGTGDGPSVPAVTLQGLLRRYPWHEATLICDIEGAETELVAREGELLGRHFHTLVLEIHPEFRSAAECEELLTRLDALGFREVACVRKVHAFRQSPTSDAVRGVPWAGCIPPPCRPAARGASRDDCEDASN